ARGLARTRAAWRGALALLLLTIALGPAAGGTLRAQAAGVVGGTVVTDGVLQPLAGVQITVTGTDLAALTDASGRFTISGVQGSQVELQARRIGYRPATVNARVGD